MHMGSLRRASSTVSSFGAKMKKESTMNLLKLLFIVMLTISVSSFYGVGVFFVAILLGHRLSSSMFLSFFLAACVNTLLYISLGYAFFHKCKQNGGKDGKGNRKNRHKA